MATLKDIATELGLSPATVSRALNGFPEVNTKTREKVNETARRLNYRPNTNAQRLVSGKSGMVGVVLKTSKDQTADPTFFEVTGGLSMEFAKQDRDLIFQMDISEDHVAPYRRLLEKSAVDGFIIQGPERNDPRIAFLQEHGVPFVVHGKAETGDVDYAYYDIDNYAAAAEATSLLANLGHRRIAFLNGPAELAFARDRRRGFLDVLASFGIEGGDAWIRNGEQSRHRGHEVAGQMLDQSNTPTAFLCVSTLVAAGVYDCLKQRGLNCPQDVSVVAHDDAIITARAVDFSPPLTVTRAPMRDACIPLAKMLGEIVDDPTVRPPQRTQKADLIVRGSTAAAPQEK